MISNHLAQAQAQLLEQRRARGLGDKPKRADFRKIAKEAEALHEIIEEPLKPVERKDVPFRLDQLDTSHPSVRRAVDAAKAWQKRKYDPMGYPEASLVLCGSFGTGKTHIARAIYWCDFATQDGQPTAPNGRFYEADTLIQSIEPGRGLDSLIPFDIPILVIDDIGSEEPIYYAGSKSENQARAFQARYFKVINYCYARKISVIVTSNLSIDALAKRLGGRAWDRLCEMAPAGFMLEMGNAPSWRQKVGGRS